MNQVQNPQLDAVQLESLALELDQLLREEKARLGQADARYLQQLIFWQRCAALSGRLGLLLCWFSWWWLVPCVLLLALAIPLLVTAPSPQPQQGSNSAQHWQPWSAETLQQLRQQGKPVLVNMTADWCITCLVNERVALSSDSTKAALALYDVTYLKGDWTLRDAAITEYLRLYQRDGVPLYVLYWPGQQPEVLPQILTPDTVPQALARLSRQP